MKKGIMPTDIDEIKNHKLYMRGDCWTPSRFYDYALVNINRDMSCVKSLLINGFIETNLQNTVNRFDGISYEYLRN